MNKTLLTLLIRPLNVLTVRAELVEAKSAFRQAKVERILKLHEAGSIVFGKRLEKPGRVIVLKNVANFS